MGNIIRIGEWIKANPPSWVTKSQARSLGNIEKAKKRDELRKAEHHAETVMMVVPKGTALELHDKGLDVHSITRHMGNTRVLVISVYQSESDNDDGI